MGNHLLHTYFASLFQFQCCGIVPRATPKVPFSNNRYQHREVAAKFLLRAYSGTSTDTKRTYLNDLVMAFKERNDPEEAEVLVKFINDVLDELCKIFVD